MKVPMFDFGASWLLNEVPRRWFWAGVVFCALVGFGIVANPWIRTRTIFYEVLLSSEILLAIGFVPYMFWRTAQRERSRQEKPTIRNPIGLLPSIRALILLLGITLLWAILYRERWISPERRGDDPELYAAAADWATTLRNLFVPHNEHLLVPSRVLTYFVVRFSDESSRDFVAAVATASLFLPAIVLVFLLSRREWQCDFAGLLAATFFVLSTSDREIILWYAASQWLITLNLLLVALLLLQHESDQLPRWRVALACLLALFAPFSLSIGTIVGPILSIWIAVRCGTQSKSRSMGMILAPSIASAAGMVIVLPILLSWMGSVEYEASGLKGVIYAPWEGMIYTARTVVDNLLIRNFGIDFLAYEPWRYVIMFPVLPILFAAVLWIRPRCWRLFPMVSIMVLGYAATIPFRTWISYGAVAESTRYQLFPQLGLALFLTGAVAEVFPELSESPGGRLGLMQGILIALLALGIMWLQVT